MPEKKMSKSKKIIIIVFAVILVAAVIVGILMWKMSGKKNINEVLSLGNNYLSELNYRSAIEEYNRVLAIDPVNKDALAGLAASYAAMGDIDMAKRIFDTEELLDSDNVVALRTYATAIAGVPGSLPEVIDIACKLIRQEDSDEDYELYKETLKQILDVAYEYSETDAVAIELNSAKVQSKGTNILGSLGTEVGFREESKSEIMSDAGFEGEPKSVFTTGTLSVVIDKEGNIWSAGSNRSGQQAKGTSELIVQPGWHKDEGISDVVKIAGCDSTLFALTSDGKLYMAGENDGYMEGLEWLPDWTRITRYGDVIDLQYSVDENSTNICFLTVDGELYSSNDTSSWYNGYNTYSQWTRVARNVSMFSLYKNSIIYVTKDGMITSNDGRYEMPAEWAYENNQWYYVEYKVPFEVSSMAAIEDKIFLMDKEQNIYCVEYSNVRECNEDDSIIRIYSSGNKCVAQLYEGSYKLLD